MVPPLCTDTLGFVPKQDGSVGEFRSLSRWSEPRRSR